MIFDNANESIEGKIISCSFRRKFKPFRPEQNDILNCNIYPFEIGNDARAKIATELKPKEFKIKVESHL